MRLVSSQTEPITIYHALVDVVNPRPIAWVTSLDEQGRVNLAPFSFFNVFGSNPPVVVFSPTTRRDGRQKDTLINVSRTREFVVNLAVESLAESVNLTSKELPHGESEVELAKLEMQPSVMVLPPRVTDSPVHLECRLREVLTIGDQPLAANLVIGEVVLIDIDDRVLGGDGRVDPRKLKTVGRMGGDFWCYTTDLFTLDRP